jgi:hypothetical protein
MSRRIRIFHRFSCRRDFEKCELDQRLKMLRSCIVNSFGSFFVYAYVEEIPPYLLKIFALPTVGVGF